MLTENRPHHERYGAAVLAVMLALLLTQMSGDLLKLTPTSLFFAAVMLSVWWGGIKAGLLATALSALAVNYFFIPPLHALSVHLDDLLRIVVFGLVASVSNMLVGRQTAELARTNAALPSEVKEHQLLEPQTYQILESIADGFVAFDSKWSFTYVNCKAARILGKSPEQLCGKNIWQEFPILSNTSLGQVCKRAAGLGVPQQVEDYYPPFNGWFAVRAYPFPDGMSLLFEDISERQAALRDRKQAEEEFSQILARERVARTEAETANRLKDEFLAVLAHELRSPLNPILGWTKLLLNRKFDEVKTTNALLTIERNAKLQSQLVEDLLDVSRILRGKLYLNLSTVDLVTTIEGAIETVRMAAEAKSIQIHTILDQNVGSVSGDPNRLQQAVLNLLTNAIKFTPQGGRVEISLKRLPAQVQLQVSDTGKGINPDFLPFVFDYFRQADSSTTRQFGGLGLGLAIVRHLVELHGGEVCATSLGEGQGATFTVTLPLSTVVSSESEEEVLSENCVNLEGLRVLVVDDEVDTRQLLIEILEHYGAEVTAAASAGEAMRSITQWQPNLLVSDIAMPEVDGYMLIRQIRAKQPEQGGTIPAIALTAYAGEANQQQILKAGFHRHVTKPVEPIELAKAIANLVA